MAVKTRKKNLRAVDLLKAPNKFASAATGRCREPTQLLQVSCFQTEMADEEMKYIT